MSCIELCITILFSMGTLNAALSDLETRRVSNKVIIYLAGISLARVATADSWPDMLGILYAGLLWLFCYRRGRGIGGADIKLAAVLGMYHGPVESIAVFLSACISALLSELAMRFFGARHKGGIPLCFYMGISSIIWCMVGIGTQTTFIKGAI